MVCAYPDGAILLDALRPPNHALCPRPPHRLIPPTPPHPSDPTAVLVMYCSARRLFEMHKVRRQTIGSLATMLVEQRKAEREQSETGSLSTRRASSRIALRSWRRSSRSLDANGQPTRRLSPDAYRPEPAPWPHPRRERGAAPFH